MALGDATELLQMERIGPKDPIEPFIEQANNWEQDVMVVGHLPFMARAASQMLAGSEEILRVAYQPGSLVCLEKISPGHYALVYMIRPELIAT